MILNDLDLSARVFLVVDDNRFMRSVIKGLLFSFGATVVIEANNGASALEVIFEEEIDFIITDLVMDPLNGLELTKLIRRGSDSKNCHIPILMVSGHTDVKFVRAARDMGADSFLSKPVSAKSLSSRINNILTTKRPFIKALPGYVGPDRRRKKKQEYTGVERRQK